MADPVDFIPSPCSATAIANCIAAKACSMEEFKLEAVADVDSGGGLGGSLSAAASIQFEVNSQDLCLIEALTLAFAIEGVPMPSIPAPTPPPVFDDAMSAIGDMKAVADEPLGHLAAVFDVTYDENGIPIRIRTGV